MGDLYQKLGKTPDAADVWERAMNRYADGGFANNAIAMCNKILRVAPGRTNIYLRLAQLMVQRGLASEAKQHFLEYASRMQQAGKLDQAFKALKEFADLSPDNGEIRLMLAEQLKAAARTDEAREQLAKLYAETQGDERRSRATLTQIKAIDPDYNPETDPKAKAAPKSQKSHDLVFLDLDEAPAPPKPSAAPKPAAAKPAPPPPPPPKPAPAPAAKAPPPPPPAPEPEPEPDLGIQRSSVQFETTGAGTDQVEELDTAAPLGLEPTAVSEPGAAADIPLMDVTDVSAGGLDLGAADLQGLSLDVPELDLASVGEPTAADLSPPTDFLGADALEVDLGAETTTAPPGIPDLERAVADDPDDPSRHRALAEALIESGERERGLQELDITMSTWESREEWQSAQDLVDEILRLDPNSIRHHQKRVEYAFRLGDKPNLINAYLELADAFFRSGEMDRARTVYQRVLEHDAGNQRAVSALSTLEPAPPPPPKPSAKAPAAPAAPAAGDFVNLGEFIMGDDEGPKDTRLRIQDEEPTGDEERDFKDMLDQFKKGIDATLGEDDSQAHYDLGVAFKEMGLLDEAIAEFQKALRSQDMRIRTAESLGVCFFEKGQPAVAATVLRRAIEQDPGSDENKIGLLYWLGRSEEEQGKMGEALTNYQRVFALDIRFQDVSNRVKTLAKAGR
ncbi:MAG: tetratricopeptide repeat protein [Gemmatimonadetes bacterium]|nr:tetratricopeptide repeat protein [Gemmatimonadota bacterium]